MMVEIVQISVSNEKRIRFNMSLSFYYSFLFMSYNIVYVLQMQKYE